MASVTTVTLPTRAFIGGDDTKVFLLTSTYGVMAGTLTGLASLAFYEDPSERLRNVAMGASIGLYAGIALGAYLTYAVPDPAKPSSGGGSGPSAPTAPPVNRDDPLNLEGAELARPTRTPALAWQPILGAGPQGWVVGVGLRY